jgi:hypothetical protein
MLVLLIGKVKVKLYLYRPWRSLREVEAPTFSDIRHLDGGKVVSPMRRPYSFLLEAESNPGPSCSWKDVN